MSNIRSYLQYVFLFIVVLLVFSISGIVALYTDYLWFSALEFKEIFTISLFAKIIFFIVAALSFFIFAAINLWIASKFQVSKISFKIGISIIALLSLFQGLSASAAWLTFLQYLNQVPFGLQDPILGKDVAFYVFSLPFFLVLWRFVFAAVIITTIVVLLYYLYNIIISFFTPQVDPNTNTVYKSFNFWQEISKVKKSAMTHMAILFSLIFLLLAARHYLERFLVMYSESGIVVGAGYTDVVIFIPVVKFLMVFAIFVAILFYIWIFFFSKSQKIGKRHLVIFVLVLYVAFVVVGQSIIPQIVQSLKVSPNEINLEKPYLENNIKFTKIAYGLDVEERDFDVEQTLDANVIDKSSETIDNVRILDYRPLTQTYKQTQEIRLYYDLSGIDIDRYSINGKYTQVMLAPRELDQNQIADNAKTWVNLHMVYSHGFGVVVSPVNKVTDQGLPNYLVKDIPPSYTVAGNDLKIDQPRIYYGENENDFILVNTNTDEFDFPKGNTNEYINYDGAGGVVLDSFVKKLFMAVRFADIKILLSSDITSESRMMFLRNIQERISKITPFLLLDDDPYIVINEGKLLWIQDAYTVTGNFPYSQKFGRINYIRNSVKIVVDAYNGDVTYYIIDEKDPLMKVYANIFPGQFKSFDEFPESLKEHIRYPEDLFKVQSSIYSTYHMEDPTVFYNKEDAWEIPSEIYGTGQQIEVEPYYIIMKLPGERKEEFVLMTTFTPLKKDNMNAWFAARSDGEDYGKLLLFKFPKDKLVYGPLQIEARIDQDSEISQQLTLWGQQGSRVTRGNLLVIPIENSLLYIEPLYLQAEKGQLPELKRVIVSDGERVIMEKDLATGLQKLFGSSTSRTVEIVGDASVDKSEEDLIKEANDYYDAILDAMNKGDWVVFGANFDKLGDVIGSLGEKE
tara:strand:- start:7820 stop:10543 length:2724 start_codon:yes stop_codon:yes gene_type:complete